MNSYSIQSLTRKHRVRGLAVRLLLGSALGALAAVAPVLIPTAQAQVTQNFDIPAQPLPSALNTFGRQSGLQISLAASVARGMSSRPVRGALTASQALSQLLRGTGIPFQITADGTALIGAVGAASGQAAPVDGAILLDTITLSAAGTGGVPAAYAGGQVATGGGLGMLGNKELMDTPFSTVNYTSDYVANRQAQNISEVIAATDPSVFTTGSSGMIADGYWVRGLRVAVPDATVGGLHGVTPHFRATPEMFERVEVLKGPSALLNGMAPNGSVGGVINLVPKRAPEGPLTNVTLTYMNDAQLGGHVDLGRRFGQDKQFGLRFNGVYRDGDTSVDGQQMGTRLAALGFDWEGENARISADIYYSRQRVDGVNRGVSLAPGVDLPSAPKPDTLLNPDWTFLTTDDKAAIIRGEYDLTPAITAYAVYGASKTDYDGIVSGSHQIFNDKGDYRTNVAHTGFSYDKRSAEIGVRGQFDTGSVAHEWTINATQFKQDYGFRSVYPLLAEDWITNIYDPVWGPAPGRAFNDAPPKINSVKMRSFGIADTLSFAGGRAQLTAGLRHQSVVSDSFDANSGKRTERYEASANSPAVALNYRLTDQISVYGNYMEGLSAGSTAPAYAANAGEVFPPYKTRQKEVGLKWDLGEMTHSFSLYDIRQPNRYTDPVTNVFSFGGEQRNRGAEWSENGGAKLVHVSGGMVLLRAA
ncbi:TonB-dependent receptor [Paracoccus xiamenensis]|uniref:TonB-dependent receptor n=1 Tax=Paracoccus xiamenensis TaxID=2714901 RepID=UPI00140A22A1|nr:TonB-dependent receptor [Paracoccus xiamenensis]NHF74743.1 TonB-dependent receptor [Paracoccus xiamenensis]